jgi:hypothetical protein
MRRSPLLIVSLLVVAACGSPDASDAPRVEGARPPSTTSTTVAPPVMVAPTPSETPRKLLTSENLPEGTSLVARAIEAVEVFAEPGAPQPLRTLDPTTILGTPTVLSILEGPDDGWARVLLPGRPNGSEGWVDVAEMPVYVVHGQLVVDLSERSLSYYEDGEEVLSTTVAVGSPRNPTPTGSFFVTDNVTLADPNSPWGPHALGLSARSDTITEYNGGDGIIGIHGTNKPGSIGNAASLGCVRVPNDVITRLHELIAVGTPVEIEA